MYVCMYVCNCTKAMQWLKEGLTVWRKYVLQDNQHSCDYKAKIWLNTMCSFAIMHVRMYVAQLKLAI